MIKIITTIVSVAVGLGAMAALSMADAQTKPGKPVFRLCTGNDQLNYFKAGQHLKKQSGYVTVDVLTSKGSIDNLDKITAGECDGGFVQNDALLVYSQRNASAISALQRVGVLYREQVHMLCNRKAFTGSRMVDLNNTHRVAVGPDGSGGQTTWAGFVIADKKRYGPVGTEPTGGLAALTQAADGSNVTCALIVAALNSSMIKDTAAKLGNKIVLVGTDDRDMAHTKDARGRPIYEYGEIPADTYPALQPSGTVYGTKAVGTVQVDAVFVVNSNWINANPEAYDRVLQAFLSAGPDIEKLAKPQ